MAPPLTVVLVNNKGGGIFSFLPVAGAVGQEAFERLWGTPQNVDLEGRSARWRSVLYDLLYSAVFRMA
jgi:2-succinyl-5-enolpyruvyl-6-hydroxy-3-cyclohexene-1-carboxylate synthase